MTLLFKKKWHYIWYKTYVMSFKHVYWFVFTIYCEIHLSSSMIDTMFNAIICFVFKLNTNFDILYFKFWYQICFIYLKVPRTSQEATYNRLYVFKFKSMYKSNNNINKNILQSICVIFSMLTYKFIFIIIIPLQTSYIYIYYVFNYFKN